MSTTLNVSKEQMMDLDSDLDDTYSEVESLSWEDDYDESDSENYETNEDY